MGRIFRWQRMFDQLYWACTVLTHLQLVDEVEAHQAFADWANFVQRGTEDLLPLAPTDLLLVMIADICPDWEDGKL